jgi:hypothetical protein
MLMKCSLNCFLNFFEAETTERRTAVLRQYKRGTTGAVKGMNTYYFPALRAIRGTLCPHGTFSEKLAAVRQASFSLKSTDKLNDARIESNTRVFRAFHAEFGGKRLCIRANPQLEFKPITDLVVNLKPDLFGEVDDVLMLWKFGICKKPRPLVSVRALIQAAAVASESKGLHVPIHQIRYLDTFTGKTFSEALDDAAIRKKLEDVAYTLSQMWDKVA